MSVIEYIINIDYNESMSTSEPQGLCDATQYFLTLCDKGGTRVDFLKLAAEINILPSEERNTIFNVGFRCACANHKLEVVEYLLSELVPDWIPSIENFYSGLLGALTQSEPHILEYVLERSPLELKEKCSTKPYRNFNLRLFTSACQYAPSSATLEYLANFIEHNITDEKGEAVNLWTLKGTILFTNAWLSGPEHTAAFLINRYHLTGTEPEIVDILSQSPYEPEVEAANRLRALMQIQLDKSLLERTVPPTKAPFLAASQDICESSTVDMIDNHMDRFAQLNTKKSKSLKNKI